MRRPLSGGRSPRRFVLTACLLCDIGGLLQHASFRLVAFHKREKITRLTLLARSENPSKVQGGKEVRAASVNFRYRITLLDRTVPASTSIYRKTYFVLGVYFIQFASRRVSCHVSDSVKTVLAATVAIL